MKTKKLIFLMLNSLSLIGLIGCNAGSISNNQETTSNSKDLKYFRDFSSKFCIVNSSDSDIKVKDIQVLKKEDWITDPHKVLSNLTIPALDVACVNLETKGKWGDIIGTSPYLFSLSLQTDKGDLSFQVDQSNSTGNINNMQSLDHNRSTTEEYRVFHKAGDDSGFPTNVFIVEESLDKQQKFLGNWMSSLPNSAKLGQIMIPGAHDAGVNYDDGLTCTLSAMSWSTAQSVSIAQENTQSNQLKDGVRYFDIRLENSNGVLYPYHKTVNLLGCRSETAFEQTLQNIVNFIQKHPSETVILRFTHSEDVTEDTINLLNKFINNNPQNFYVDSQDDGQWQQKTMDKLRGKIVLLMGCEFSNYWNARKGFFRYAKQGNVVKCSNDDADSMVIYDKYSNTQDFNLMHNDQFDKLLKAANSPDQLTLLSWTLTTGEISAHTPRPAAALAHYAKYFGKEIEAKSFIDGQPMPRLPNPNIIYYDFENPGVNNILIKRAMSQVLSQS